MAVNGDLRKERSASTVNPNHITCVLYGREAMHKRRLAFERACSDPAFKVVEDFMSMPREDTYGEAVKVYIMMVQRMKEYGYVEGTEEHAWFSTSVFMETQPFDIHHGAFIPTIMGQGTPEQIKEFMPKVQRLEYIGTYAQTELGHGTFLRGLETTAEYDKHTQEFIMHSPTLTSMKYWPGGLARTCNYAVVMAQLIIDGKNYGLHPFMCQLRDLETHQPLSGVELGDINSKLGTNAMDNGYMRLNRHRIPRTNMLMKYSQVTPDGEFHRQAVPPQVGYLSMTYLRMVLIMGAGTDLAKAATIATRYSAVRRQTANSEGVEPQVIDYQTQQMKLFPAISTAYALIFAASAVKNTYKDILAAVDNGDLSRLPELHSLTAGLKAFASDEATHHIEICRRSCGGHGYSHASGIPRIFQRSVAICTVEGENTVMYLQCARSLMKFLSKARAGEPVPPTMSFLQEGLGAQSRLASVDQFDFTFYCEAIKFNALCMIEAVELAIKRDIESAGAMNMESAWLANAADLVDIAKAYSRHVTVQLFHEAIERNSWQPQAKQLILSVYEFYLVNSILSSGSFLQHGVLTSRQMTLLTSRRKQLMSVLRKDAVTLVDAFDFPDRLLNSCLGRYDGNVYEALYDYAKKSPLNHEQVHSSYYNYIKPMQKALKANL